MRQEAWRAYLELALGLTEASRKKATQVAKDLVGRSSATTEQLQALTEEVIRTSMANREAIAQVVRAEFDRALDRVSLAVADEMATFAARVRHIERQVRAGREAADDELGGDIAGTGPAARAARAEAADLAGTGGGKAQPTAGRATARKATAKKATAKKTAAKKTAAKKTAAKKAPKRTAAKKATAKKTAGKKSAATVKKSAPSKSAPGTATDAA